MPMLDRETLDRITAEAKGFVENYYRTFDANRAELVNLYREESVMNFECRERIKGKEAIVAKLTSLQQCQLHISKMNCSPVALTRGALVLAIGFLWLDGKPEALSFSQSFFLEPTPEGSFYIQGNLWKTFDRRQKMRPII
ncbi:nuclear transport factor 2B-like [Syzygium oleosum]|uniref:nuclear transport factor 2B-like n=1 Tax=Syzygium oleosum TaxID=219896 RepID=UPI0024BA60B5|nr:nuclear transport factor 2B-like [Syzygium oleosum]